MISVNDITYIVKCKCDYISVQFNNNFWNTMKEETFQKYFKVTPIKNSDVYCCDACNEINNYTVENGEYILGLKKQFVSKF